jgi:2'-5' RNA ligase
MAFLGLQVPHETARLLSGIDVPGDREPTSHFHVTMFFFGDDLDIDHLAGIIRAAFGVTTQTRPFTVGTSSITSFPSEGSKPIICRVESDELHALRERIRKVFDEEGVEYNQRHPEFKPHVTLAYDDSGEDFEDQSIPTVEWGAHELVLWGGNSGDDRLVVSFPFVLNPDKAKVARVVQRFLGT